MNEVIFESTQSFMRAPQIREVEVVNSNVIVFGVPFDCGTSTTRIGARHGPDAIRKESLNLGPYNECHPSVHLIEAHDVVDAGNVRVIPSDIEFSFSQISRASHWVASKGAACLSFGGDGAVTLPQLRGLSATWPDLVVIHIDAHTDTYPYLDGANPHNTATTFYCAVEEELIIPNQSFHIGFHGDTSIPNACDHAEEMGFNMISLSELLQLDFRVLKDEIANIVEDKPVYLCFDMDVFDPSCAPGVCNPTWGGLNAREGISLVRTLAGLNIVAIDINTVSPPHDNGGMTAWLASTVAHECLSILL